MSNLSIKEQIVIELIGNRVDSSIIMEIFGVSTEKQRELMRIYYPNIYAEQSTLVNNLIELNQSFQEKTYDLNDFASKR